MMSPLRAWAIATARSAEREAVATTIRTTRSAARAGPTSLRRYAQMASRSSTMTASNSSAALRRSDLLPSPPQQPRFSFFSTSSVSRQAKGPPPRHAPRMLSAPSDPEEPDVYSKGPDPNILLTDRASRQLSKVAQREGPDKAKRMAFRIAVEPGGCHGYQYKMELVEADEGQESPAEEDDFCFQPSTPPSEAEKASSEPLRVLIDSVSLALLRGSTIDYVTELIGSQFAIKDNPQAKGAGCGCGVSWEPV